MTLRIRYDDDGALGHPLYARFATIVAGAPGKCPECDAFGYIDHLDVGQQVQDQHCRVCGYSWEYRFDADGRIEEVREIPARDWRQATLPRRVPAEAGADRVIDLTSAPAPTPPRPARRRKTSTHW